MLSSWLEKVQNLVPLESLKEALIDAALGERDPLAFLKTALPEMERNFPGLWWANISAGRIPVATRVVEDQIQALVGPQNGLKGLRLRSQKERFLLELNVEKLGVQTQITLPISCERFTFEKNHQEALLKFEDEDTTAKGENWLGRLVGNLPTLILVKALQGPDFAVELNTASEGMAELNWPNLRVNLDQCDSLKPMLAYEYLGLGLLDLCTFGPLEIDQDCVWVHVKPTFGLG